MFSFDLREHGHICYMGRTKLDLVKLGASFLSDFFFDFFFGTIGPQGYVQYCMYMWTKNNNSHATFYISISWSSHSFPSLAPAIDSARKLLANFFPPLFITGSYVLVHTYVDTVYLPGFLERNFGQLWVYFIPT